MAVIDKSEFLNGVRPMSDPIRNTVWRQTGEFSSKESLGMYVNSLASVLNPYFVNQLALDDATPELVDMLPAYTTGWPTEPLIAFDWTYPPPVEPISPNGNVWDFVGYQNPVFEGDFGEKIFLIAMYGEVDDDTVPYKGWEIHLEGRERLNDGTPTGVYDTTFTLKKSLVYVPLG